MSSDERATILTSALAQRLVALGPHFGVSAEVIADYESGGASVGDLVAAAGEAMSGTPDDRRTWLAITALTGAFPTGDVVRSVRRRMRLSRGPVSWIDLVLGVTVGMGGAVAFDRRVRAVSGGVVVDVDFCAKYTHNTGIQRVVRQTMPRWRGRRDVTFVAWSQHDLAYRELASDELSRVVEWGRHSTTIIRDSDALDLVVPVDSVVVLPEVAAAQVCARTAAMARYSGNRVVMLGYDTIPIGSANGLPATEAERFTKYLAIVKNARRVAGISDTATAEFRGFAAALPSQGLPGPAIVSVPLPVAAPDSWPSQEAESVGDPLVLVVGSQEPRKNQMAVLHAAEVLWQRGLRFRLRLIGGGSRWFTRIIDGRVNELKRRGRRVEVLRGVGDDVLSASYREARFTVFPSLHEGYGLPVGESLALGVPSITTGYGATAEVGRVGGCLLIDPRNDDSIVDAMSRLLSDDELHERLRAEALGADHRSWDHYADELWERLVVPEIGVLA